MDDDGMFHRTLVTAVKYPLLAAAACAFWSFTRVLYTVGYTTGDPAKVRSLPPCLRRARPLELTRNWIG
jgi:hypothetical protein